MKKYPRYPVTLDTLTSLCKRRGFIFQGSEIYGGLNGFWDYGPLGAELKRNIRTAWWQAVVQRREDVVGLDAAIIMHPRVWEASGHVQGFTDPMVDCRETKRRYRADQLLVAVTEQEDVPWVAFFEGQEATAVKRIRTLTAGRTLPFTTRSLLEVAAPDLARVLGPDAATPGSLTPPRQFNLMFKTFVG
ncbi:MAG: glycine--tRNA ligase, partial [Candidatus Marinimicrobia bacterium]|nr:glycine--tRNA ligase [Candidatus Neomarinimicrobiota bacterium]